MRAQALAGEVWVRFIDEDVQPTVLFLPFGNQGNQQVGMKAARQQMNRSLWSLLVAEAGHSDLIFFQVCFRYEQLQ